MSYFRNPMKPIGEKPDWQPVTYIKPVNYWKRNMAMLRWLRWIAGSFGVQHAQKRRNANAASNPEQIGVGILHPVTKDSMWPMHNDFVAYGQVAQLGSVVAQCFCRNTYGSRIKNF